MKLRTLLLGAASGLTLIATAPQFVAAQIWSNYQYERGVEATPRTYRPLDNPDKVLAGNAFREPQTLFVDRDNGYFFDTTSNTFGLSLPFEFRYNTRVYSKIHVNVNGFVNFPTSDQIIPTREGNNDPTYMFIRTRPNAVIAPFWGNHHWRFGTLAGDGETGFRPTRVATKTEGVAPNRVFVIEWDNLNVNIDKIVGADPGNQRLKSSVASFQVKLYEGTNNIEFRYGPVGGNSGLGVISNGCAVGLESEDREDDMSLATSYINALFDQDETNSLGTVLSRESRQLSTVWPPSGGTDLSILFTETPTFGRFWWGDGDANLSKIRDEDFLRQYEQDTIELQRRFVSFADAALVMRSFVTDIRLDSFRFREAYHADVNHDGRFYYSKRKRDNSADSLIPNPTNPGSFLVVTWRREVPVQSEDERLGLPADSSRDRLYFQANEFDAAVILKYLSAQVTKLPWLRSDNVVIGRPRGTSHEGVATELVVKANEAMLIDGGSVRVPVYANGFLNGPISLYAQTDENIIGFEVVEKEGAMLKIMFENNRVVIAGYGEFEANEPIAYITVRATTEEFTLENVRFNNETLGNRTFLLNSGVNVAETAMTVSPNPVVSNTRISVVAPKNGVYSVNVYDMLGNKVETLFNGSMVAGAKSFEWNTVSSLVKSGMYIVRFEGEGVNMVQKINVVR